MPEKEWTLFMSGATYLKVAGAAEILGFGSVEEMFPDYGVSTTELVPEGEVVMGKNVVLGDLLVPEEIPAPSRTLMYPMTTTSPTIWPGATFTISNANATDEQRTAFATIMSAGK